MEGRGKEERAGEEEGRRDKRGGGEEEKVKRREKREKRGRRKSVTFGVGERITLYGNPTGENYPSSSKILHLPYLRKVLERSGECFTGSSSTLTHIILAFVYLGFITVGSTVTSTTPSSVAHPRPPRLLWLQIPLSSRVLFPVSVGNKFLKLLHKPRSAREHHKGNVRELLSEF